jgi:hypothetical protein
MSKLPLLLPIALLACPMMNSSWAQEAAAPSDPYAQLRPYPDEAQIAYHWAYSCPNRGGCTFLCPGASVGGAGASRVKKLDIYLGKIPGDADSHALYYSFATEYSPTAYGFALGGKLTALACQIVGMTLDYSGPPKGNSALTSKNN